MFRLSDGLMLGLSEAFELSCNPKQALKPVMTNITINCNLLILLVTILLFLGIKDTFRTGAP